MDKKLLDAKEKWIKSFVQEKLDNGNDLKIDKDIDIVIFHQDAFAADYQIEELLLLGAFIKKIGMEGKEIRITGKNRETLK